MRAIVLAVILAALASWYFHFGRQMTQASVGEFYQEQLDLMNRFEAEALCTTMAEEYRAVDVAFSSSGTERTELDKFRACQMNEQALSEFKLMSDRTRGLLAPTFSTHINSITLGDSDKLATVEGTMTVRMGEMLIARTRFTERLIRRAGTIRSLGGESKTWAYAGD